MQQTPMSLIEFQKKFAAEEACQQHLFHIRWPELRDTTVQDAAMIRPLFTAQGICINTKPVNTKHPSPQERFSTRPELH